MGSCQAGHNLHLCLAHHPPLVCATLILLLLGLSGLGLGGFLLTHTSGLRSPDIPQVSPRPGAHPAGIRCPAANLTSLTLLLHTGLGFLLEGFWPAEPVPREWDSHREVARASRRRLTYYFELRRWSR